MKDRPQSTWLIAALLIGSGCLIVLCLVGLVFFGGAFFFGATAGFGDNPPAVETNSPSAAQISHCRQALAIRPEAQIDVEWYFFQAGFLDDSLQCRLTASATTLDELFDSAQIDLTRLDEQQQIAPGRYLELDVIEIEPGLYLISGAWFET